MPTPSWRLGGARWHRAILGQHGRMGEVMLGVVRDGIAQYWDSTDGRGMLGVVRDGIAQYLDNTDGWE